MFIKLLHGLTATLGRVKQLWTKENVPDGVQTMHDFNDGDGLVPAIPLDELPVNAALNKLTIATTPNDILKPISTIHSMTVATEPTDMLIPITSINTMRVITSPHDILTHSLSLMDFIIEEE